MALVFALFFLKESSPEILKRRAKKTKMEEKSESTTDATASSEVNVEMREKPEPKPNEKIAKPKVQITLTMMLCFIFEFCIRWDINIFNSRYGIYLQDRFNTSSKAFS